MKRNLKSVVLGGCMAVVALPSFAQLQDEQDVTITMDLQPILQLSMEGPNQIDFTFDEINKYYAGVTKTGANILRVSSSVSFDLWATGVSTGSLGAAAANALLWDNPVSYGVGTLAGNSNNLIPLTALELHQFPANPSIGGGCGTTVAASSDYSAQFAPYDFVNGDFRNNITNASALGNNAIYCTLPTTPYARPTSTAVAATSEKYIAGGTGTGANCQVNAGSWLFGSFSTAGAVQNSTSAGANPQTVGGYYFVMDYRILPGLPAKFPSTVAVNNVNATAPYLTAAEADGDINAAPSGGTANTFAAPGVYTMFVKYILQEDQ